MSAPRLLATTMGICLSAAAAAEPPALRVDAPLPGLATRLPLIEVAGGAGRGAEARWDVVIVLDLSDSTLHPSGLDLDGDGPDGRSDPALVASFVPDGMAGVRVARRLREDFDFDDTILAAEIEAAEALLSRTNGPRLRSGLIGFSDDAVVLAPLGSPLAQHQQALAQLRLHLGGYLRGTHYAAALDAAARMLIPDPEAVEPDRQRVVVFLTDGTPSLPVRDGDRGRLAALEAARALGLAGIRLHAFAFGSGGAAAGELLAEMAAWSDGDSQRVEEPEQLVAALRELQLVDVTRVAITNETTGARARAVRLFPDGSFDALLQLAPGQNVLRVEAFVSDGSGVSLERSVQRLPGDAGREEAARERALLDALRQRTAETEAWAAVEKRRQAERRALRIEVASPPGRVE